MNRNPLAVLALCLFACGRSPYPGYKEVSVDVYMRYIVLGDGDRLVQDSDSVHMRFRMARLGEEPGSFWSMDEWYLAKDIRMGAMLPIFRRLHQGDSMSVITRGMLWPWPALQLDRNDIIADTSQLCTELSLLDLRTPAQMRADAERLKRNDPAGYERRLIAAYIRHSKTEWTQWGTSDLYYRIEGTAVDTNKARYRETVQLAWEGRRLEDGQVFDVQGMHGTTFPWSYGTPDQVIKGIEAAASLLREGQEGTFIIPSMYAFGSRGIEGTLEPNSPVVYTVRLVAVERS